jgi:hypothetical protein
MQIKLLFKYLDPAIPANVHVFYQYQDKDVQIQQFTDFFTTFNRAKLVLHKNTAISEMIDLVLMSDVLMVSESSLGTHLSVMSQRPMVFAKPAFGEGNARGCVQGEHVCIHRDPGTTGSERDSFVRVYAEELSLRWEAWKCAKEFIEETEK